jgi:hypothetical protein
MSWIRNTGQQYTTGYSTFVAELSIIASRCRFFSYNLIDLIFNWSVFRLVEALRGGIISGELNSQQMAGTEQMLLCPLSVNPKLMAKTFRFISDLSC